MTKICKACTMGVSLLASDPELRFRPNSRLKQFITDVKARSVYQYVYCVFGICQVWQECGNKTRWWSRHDDLDHHLHVTWRSLNIASDCEVTLQKCGHISWENVLPIACRDDHIALKACIVYHSLINKTLLSTIDANSPDDTKWLMWRSP